MIVLDSSNYEISHFRGLFINNVFFKDMFFSSYNPFNSYSSFAPFNSLPKIQSFLIPNCEITPKRMKFDSRRRGGSIFVYNVLSGVSL